MPTDSHGLSSNANISDDRNLHHFLTISPTSRQRAFAKNLDFALSFQVVRESIPFTYS